MDLSDLVHLFLKYHSWLIGGVTVIAMSYNRFNTPDDSNGARREQTSRSSTTWARYHTLASLYALVLVVLWIVMVSTPDIVAALTQTAQLGGSWKDLDTPVYVAVLVTLLASSVPPFSTFDLAVRGFFQHLAEIPWEAQRLSGALRKRTWIPDEKFELQVRTALHEANFSDEEISFSSERTPQALWTRIAVLQQYIETWETRRGAFSGFYFKNKDTINDLVKKYRELETLFRRVSPMLKPSKGSQEPDPTQLGLAESFVAAAERLEENLCDFVSHGILTCGLTARSRSAEFEKIGFMVNVSPGPLFDRLVGLYVLLTVLYMGLLIFLHRPHPKLTGSVIAASYLGAVLTAFWSKRWRWARPDGDNLPIRGYLLSAVAAFVLASLTSFGLGVLTGRGVLDTWNLMSSRLWPWSLMSALVAACVAYRIDQKERPGIRWPDTVLVALACAFWAIPVVCLLHDGCACLEPPYLRVMIVSAFTGGLIGFFVPTWHRSPLTTVTWYERFKVVVIARADPGNGLVAAAINVLPPQVPGHPTPRAQQLLPVEASSTDEAIAEAVRSARAWINVQRASTTERAYEAEMARDLTQTGEWLYRAFNGHAWQWRSGLRRSPAPRSSNFSN